MSDKQIARLVWVSKLVDHCARVRLHAVYVRELRKYFSSHEWEIFSRVCDVAGVDLPLEGAQTRLIDKAVVRQLPNIPGVQLVAKHTERLRHGQNCFVVEAFFEKEYREQYEIPF